MIKNLSGGWPTRAMDYINKSGVASSSYAYVGYKQSCRKADFPPVVRLGAYCEENLNGNEERLKELVATKGPIIAAIQATNAFTQYSTGVFTDKTCFGNVNHAVLVVGKKYCGVRDSSVKLILLLRIRYGSNFR